MWINYNSERIREIVEDSLNSIAGLEYEDYVLILVDNGSNDGSGRRLCSYAERVLGAWRTRCVMLPGNRGYAGGCNAGFREAVNLGCRYVAFLNNDASPMPGSLARIIDCINGTGAAGCQGVLIERSGDVIDTAGGIVDELLYTYMMRRGEVVDASNGGGGIVPVSYLDGAYAVYRVDVLYEVFGLEPYPEDYFAYYEDVLLGLLLWDRGFRLYSVQEPAARHSRGSSFGDMSRRKAYLVLRNWATTLMLSDSPYRSITPIILLREFMRMRLRGGGVDASILRRALRDAKLLAAKLEDRRFSLRRVPRIHYNPLQAAAKLIAPWLVRSIYREAVTTGRLTMPNAPKRP